MRWLATALLAASLSAGCGDDGGGAGDPIAFCERLDDLARNDPFLAFGPRASSDEIAAAFDALVERAGGLLEVAPPDALATARDYAESAEALRAALEEAGHDPAAVDVRRYRDAEVTYAGASSRLERHLASEC